MNNARLAKALVKLAGSVAGPGIPDGTGPYADTPECPMTDEDAPMPRRRRRYLRRGPQDGTGPRGGTPECPVTNEVLAAELVRLAKSLTAADRTAGSYTIGTFGKPVKYQGKVEPLLIKEVPNAFAPNARYVKGSLRFTKVRQNPMLSGSEHGFSFYVELLDDDGNITETFEAFGKVQAGLDGREAFIHVAVDV